MDSPSRPFLRREPSSGESTISTDSHPSRTLLFGEIPSTVSLLSNRCKCACAVRRSVMLSDRKQTCLTNYQHFNRTTLSATLSYHQTRPSSDSGFRKIAERNFCPKLTTRHFPTSALFVMTLQPERLRIPSGMPKLPSSRAHSPKRDAWLP